jgi:hypothetical protein
LANKVDATNVTVAIPASDLTSTEPCDTQNVTVTFPRWAATRIAPCQGRPPAGLPPIGPIWTAELWREPVQKAMETE